MRYASKDTVCQKLLRTMGKVVSVRKKDRNFSPELRYHDTHIKKKEKKKAKGKTKTQEATRQRRGQGRGRI